MVKKESEFGWDIFIRMELLTKMNDILTTESLRQKDGIQIGIDICKALEVCERNKIIHRDIKPENIFRSDQGDYKLGDFGIARQMEKTMAGTKTGTYPYMAPEVYNRQPYNMTADIYSLGILLYRLFNNGRFPFLPPYPEEVSYLEREQADLKRMAGEEMPDPCNADTGLSQIIKRACAFNPNDRYQMAEDLHRDLKNVSDKYQYDSSASVLNPQIDTENREERGTIPITFPIESTQDSDESGSSIETIRRKGSDKDRESEKTGRKPERHHSVLIKGVCILAAVLCVIVGAFIANKIFSNSDSEMEYVENACAKDISGILYQMETRFGKDVMENARVYELSVGNYGYVIQTRNEDEVKYSFLLPRTDVEIKEKVTDSTGLYQKSLQSGVLYLMRGMNISEPVVTDSHERVVINKQSLILSKITISDYPEISEGYPATAYLITDDKDQIRRIMLLTSDGFLERSDYTYDDDDRIIKAHWTSVRMDKEQWQEMGWYSEETNSMTIPSADIDAYVKDRIVMLPKDFVSASPSGKHLDNTVIYAYDESGFVKEIDYRSDQKHIVWEFTYGGKSREEGQREWADESTSEIRNNGFVYERDKEGFVVKVNCDEGFLKNNETPGDAFSSAVGFEYTYNGDGTMDIEVVE